MLYFLHVLFCNPFMSGLWWTFFQCSHRGGGREGERIRVWEYVCVHGAREREREREGTERVGKREVPHRVADKTIVVLASLTNICGLLQVMKTAWSFQTTADICYSVWASRGIRDSFVTPLFWSVMPSSEPIVQCWLHAACTSTSFTRTS